MKGCWREASETIEPSVEEPADWFAPSRLGRYEILWELGAGGMGAVFLAHDPLLKRQVAIKTLRNGVASGKQLARFQREVRAVARMRHPNIVTLYDLGLETDSPYLVMEALEGQSLNELIGQAPQPRLLGILTQVAEAMHYAHQRGVIHRDLKPANVMVEPAGRAVVVDFGLARFLGSGRLAALTEDGVALGTPGYMSPEQCSGRPTGPAADIFAIGVILYEVLTGRLPFGQEEREDLPTGVSLTRARPPSLLVEDLPPRLEAICLRCLEVDPRRRYPTAGSLAVELREALRPIPTDPAPPTRTVPIRWEPAVLALLLVVVLIALCTA